MTGEQHLLPLIGTPVAAPALGTPVDACAVGDDGCITCGDVALPLTVVEVNADDARCRDEDGREEVVAIDLVGAVAVGDRLLVHARVALSRLDPPAPPAAHRPEEVEPHALR